MLTIIKGSKIIRWNYKRFLRNLYPFLVLIIFIGAFLLTSYMDSIVYFNK